MMKLMCTHSGKAGQPTQILWSKTSVNSQRKESLSLDQICPSEQSRKENHQKLRQLSSRSHPRHLVGKRTAQKDTVIDITSDSQVNSNFPYKWSPASLTFNNYFYLFLYLYITWITINNNAPHLKSPKNQNRRAALGRPAIKITWRGGGGFN